MLNIPNNYTKPGPKPHITPRLSVAIDQLIMEGATQAQAARIARLQPNSLWKALQKPHVKAEMKRRKNDILLNVSRRDVGRNAHLIRAAIARMNEAQPQEEQLKSLEFVARVCRL